MGLLLAFFFVSLIISFLCSLLEAVLLSITPAYVAVKKRQNSPIAQDLTRFKADIDRPLSAILTLNTIAHTVGAIGVGSQATLLFGESDLTILGLSLFSLEALIAGLMTLAILIFSEVIPKTLGANNWEALAPYSVPALKFMLFALAPLIWLTQFITRNLKKDRSRSVLTRSDFHVMTEIGRESGALNASEQEIIQNLLRFNKICVKDIMTPRIVVVSASEKMTIAEFHQQHREIPFSRIPVYLDNNANITGYVLRDEILVELAEDNEQCTLDRLKREIITINKQLPLPALMDRFIAKKEHMALVVDEFGGMEGIVTMEDAIETLLGIEIVDETDDDEDMQVLARKNWEKRARRTGLITTRSDSGTD